MPSFKYTFFRFRLPWFSLTCLHANIIWTGTLGHFMVRRCQVLCTGVSDYTRRIFRVSSKCHKQPETVTWQSTCVEKVMCCDRSLNSKIMRWQVQNHVSKLSKFARHHFISSMRYVIVIYLLTFNLPPEQLKHVPSSNHEFNFKWLKFLGSVSQ